jgi:hypothetical protein
MVEYVRGQAECEAALSLLHLRRERYGEHMTAGADKSYDTTGFVAGACHHGCSFHHLSLQPTGMIVEPLFSTHW